MNEILFYGGGVLVISALVLLLLYTCISRFRVFHIKEQLKREYGDKES